jgi:hypothetical protein
MVNYICQRCGYSTKHKNNFRKHIFKKYECKIILSDVSILNIRKNFKMNKNTILVKNDFQMTSKRLPNDFGLIHKSVKNQNNEGVYECKNCKKCFTRKNNMNYHVKHNCKEKNNIKDELNKIKNEIINLKKQNKILSKNTIKNSNIIYNNTNNIIINNFGNENLDYITDNLMKKMLLKGSNSIPSLIKQIHFNPEHPENHNIRIKNKKLKFAEIRENNKWKIKHKKAVLDDLVDFGYITLEEFKENNDYEMDGLLFKGFNRMMNSYESNKEEIMNNIELEVLNGMGDIEI